MCLGVCVIVVPNDRDETIFFVVVGNDKPVCWSLLDSICWMYLWCGGPCGGVSASNCFIVILVGCDDVVVVGGDQVAGWVLIRCLSPCSLLSWWLHPVSVGVVSERCMGVLVLFTLHILPLLHHCNKTMFYFLSVIWRLLHEYYNFTNISFDEFLPVFFVTDYFIDFVADFSGQSQY